MLVPGWTLNFEMFFYAIFAVAIFSKRVVAMTTAIIGALVMLGFALHPRGAIALTYTHPMLLEFLAGVLIGKAFSIYPFRQYWPLLPIGILAFLLVALPAFPPAWRTVVHGLPAVAIVIGALAVEARGEPLKSRTLKLIGDASYSIYLSHGFTMMFIFAAWRRLPLHGWTQFIGLTTTALIASTLVGIAVHLLIEKPLLRQINALFQGRHAITVVRPL